MKNLLKFILLLLLLSSCKDDKPVQHQAEIAAMHVLKGTLGDENASQFILKFKENEFLDSYEISVKDNHVLINLS